MCDNRHDLMTISEVLMMLLMVVSEVQHNTASLVSKIEVVTSEQYYFFVISL